MGPGAITPKTLRSPHSVVPGGVGSSGFNERSAEQTTIMRDPEGRNTTLRGKTLHPEVARRVIDRYESGHYEDAVLAAFKVIETRLRNITGKSDALVKELLHDTLNPTAGTLHLQKAWGSEREGKFLLFRGRSSRLEIVALMSSSILTRKKRLI